LLVSCELVISPLLISLSGVIISIFNQKFTFRNGLAERKHRHILETTITLLQTAHLPPKFWFHVCATSIYLINRMPCQILQHKTPYFLLYGSPPVVHHL